MTWRLLHLTHQYPPHHVGGTELYTQTIARYQQRAGHQVAVFTPAAAPPAAALPPPALEEGVQVYRIPVGRRGRGRVWADTFWRPGLVDTLQAVLSAHRPQLVHIQHLMGVPVAAVDRLVAAGVPYVVTLHDYWYGCANAQLITNDTQAICAGPDARHHNCGRCALARAGLAKGTALAPAVAPLMAARNRRLRSVLAGAAAVIAPTVFVSDAYERMGLPTGHMVVIPHGIEVPQAHVAALRRQRSPRLPAAPLHVGYIGSLGWQKGVHHLIAAVNGLPAGAVRLSIYGSLDAFPDYVAELRRQATHPGIRFMGQVSRADVWTALAQLDVVVLPTLWYEASPLTIQEVFAVGVPLVASRLGAMPEKIRDGVDGRLFPPGDAAALQAILRKFMADPALLAQLAARIRPVRTIEDQLVEIEALYARILAPEPRGADGTAR